MGESASQEHNEYTTVKNAFPEAGRHMLILQHGHNKSAAAKSLVD
jgi:hypothetical protein